MKIPRSAWLPFQATTREECGVIIGTADKTFLRLQRVENSSDDDNDYAILKESLLYVLDHLRSNEHILGFFHTHLPDHDPRPSDRDYEGILNRELINVVYHPKTGTVTFYSLEDLTEDHEA